jgi:hypothetical protein
MAEYARFRSEVFESVTRRFTGRFKRVSNSFGDGDFQYQGAPGTQGAPTMTSTSHPTIPESIGSLRPKPAVSGASSERPLCHL